MIRIVGAMLALMSVTAIAIDVEKHLNILNNGSKDYDKNKSLDYKKHTVNLKYYSDNMYSTGFKKNEDDRLYFLINFDTKFAKVLRLSLSGREGCQQWVSKFKLEASLDGKNFYAVNGGKIYDGNNDNVHKIETYFYSGFPAKVIKFIPVEYYGEASFRVVVAYEDYHIDYLDNKNENSIYHHDGKDFAHKSLYERLGGRDALDKVLCFTYDAMLVNDSYFGHRLNRKYDQYLKYNLVDFFQVLTGGPSDYHGHQCARDLKYFYIEEKSLDRFAYIIYTAFKKFKTCDEDLYYLNKQLYFNKQYIVWA